MINRKSMSILFINFTLMPKLRMNTSFGLTDLILQSFVETQLLHQRDLEELPLQQQMIKKRCSGFQAQNKVQVFSQTQDMVWNFQLMFQAILQIARFFRFWQWIKIPIGTQLILAKIGLMIPNLNSLLLEVRALSR